MSLPVFDLSNHFDDKMIRIEKYNPEQVYTVVHYEGKSKNYYVKRFVFEHVAIGKQTSIISEESGSKLILISAAAQPIVVVEQLKGKALTPETIEINLADAIDVKGMKAQGNRLTPHEVKKIELIAEHDDEEDVPDPVPETPLSEVVAAEKLDEEAEKDVPQKEDGDVPGKKAADTAAKTEPEVKPAKKIDFEITNPDDIEIDDKGQIGLF